VYEAIAKINGGIVDDKCFLVREELLVTAMRWDEAGMIPRK
jgi:hypothetical protein